MSEQSASFASFVSTERARIAKEREKLISKKSEIDSQLAELDRELSAIEAYESVKSGRAPSKSSGSGTGTRRTGQREAVLATVKAAPSGISASKVLENMGATTDADKTSVRNALSALKKAGSIKLDNGLYSA